jgi:hypothetical protein
MTIKTPKRHEIFQKCSFECLPNNNKNVIFIFVCKYTIYQPWWPGQNNIYYFLNSMRKIELRPVFAKRLFLNLANVALQMYILTVDILMVDILMVDILMVNILMVNILMVNILMVNIFMVNIWTVIIFTVNYFGFWQSTFWRSIILMSTERRVSLEATWLDWSEREWEIETLQRL